MITAEIPGKLYVAGEYAVLEPGGTAVLVAVDRYLTVRLSPAAANAPGRRTVMTAHTGSRAVELVRHGATSVAAEADPVITSALRHVLAAVDLVERLARERGDELLGFRVEILSDLDEAATGRKFALGSSGAVTVGVIRALAQAYRFGLDEDALLRLALLTAFTVDPNCSGGDVAASMLGGWVAYRAPDRARLTRLLAQPDTRIADLLEQPWPELSARRLPAPRAVRLEVGWSGQPAVSSGLVDRLRRGVAGDTAAYGRFVAGSNACVATLVAGLESGDDSSAVVTVATAGALLRAVSGLAGAPVETATLTALRGVAETLGAVAKSSGAGGGDCGIALVSPATAAQLRRGWRAVGVEPLGLQVHHQFSVKRRNR
ncbi:phosphomevalonate kinase [Nocardia crassostreae]|uniref:phosphomevalonate kinase n=1 Tax=Nocardia crassostreae TaxID=53428 RepID=UPI00082E6853|nr:phosphomevalonate kinase [Nocardia crassostreae]